LLRLSDYDVSGHIVDCNAKGWFSAMILLGYIIKIFLSRSAQLKNVFSGSVSKVDTQLGNLREET
jgi:hypothetical protein